MPTSEWNPTTGMSWERFVDELISQPGWEWVHDWIVAREFIFEQYGDKDSVKSICPNPASRVPEGISKFGCNGKTKDGLRWVSVDLDVGKSTEPYHDVSEAISAGEKLRRAAGWGELRRSSSGAGVAFGIRLSRRLDLKATDGASIGRFLVSEAGVKCDRGALGRQCRWFWRQDLAAESFQHVEGSPDGTEDEENDLLGRWLKWRSAPENQPAQAIQGLQPRYSTDGSRLDDVSGDKLVDSMSKARHYLSTRDPGGQDPRGTRMLMAVRFLYHDLALPLATTNELLREHGWHEVTMDVAEAMCRTCQSKRGSKAAARMTPVVTGARDTPRTGGSKPDWLHGSDRAFGLLGKSSFVVLEELWSRTTPQDNDSGWTTPVNVSLPLLGNRSTQTNLKAIRRLEQVGLVDPVGRNEYRLLINPDMLKVRAFASAIRVGSKHAKFL